LRSGVDSKLSLKNTCILSPGRCPYGPRPTQPRTTRYFPDGRRAPPSRRFRIGRILLVLGCLRCRVRWDLTRARRPLRRQARWRRPAPLLPPLRTQTSTIGDGSTGGGSARAV
jgi:hypothetical protein